MNYSNLTEMVADTDSTNFDNLVLNSSSYSTSTYNLSIEDANLGDFRITNGIIKNLNFSKYTTTFKTSDGYSYGSIAINSYYYTAPSKIWYQHGNVGLEATYNFARIRWEGWTYYYSSDNGHKLIYDLILLSNNYIYLIVSKVPTLNVTSSHMYFTWYGDNAVLIDVSETNTKFCLKPTDVASGSNVTHFGFEVAKNFKEPVYYELRYFIKNNDTVYTIVDSTLKECSEITKENGMTSLPSYDSYSSLSNPEVLILCSSDSINPEITETYIPKKKDYETEDYICDFKVNKIWITADDTTKFQMSFDGGETWEYYSNESWIEATDISTGNTCQEIPNIPMAQWQAKNIAQKIRFRFRLTSTDQHVDKIEIGNQDSYEGAYGEVCPY